MAEEAKDAFDDDESKIERDRPSERAAQMLAGEVMVTMVRMVMMLVIVTA